MDIFGIGPLELVFILIIALIVMGPTDMAKAGRTIGRTLRMITKSQTWQVIRVFMREMSAMPNRLMREAQFDDILKEVSEEIKQPIAEIKATTDETKNSISYSAWANPPQATTPTDNDTEKDEFEQRTIAPPENPKNQDSETPNETSSDDINLNHA